MPTRASCPQTGFPSEVATVRSVAIYFMLVLRLRTRIVLTSCLVCRGVFVTEDANLEKTTPATYLVLRTEENTKNNAATDDRNG